MGDPLARNTLEGQLGNVMWAFAHGDSWTGMPKASASEHSVFAKQSWVFKSRNAQAQKNTQDQTQDKTKDTTQDTTQDKTQEQTQEQT